jgi:hypothetical protein
MQIWCTFPFMIYLSISILLTNYAFLANHGIKRACFVTHDKLRQEFVFCLFFFFFLILKH